MATYRRKGHMRRGKNGTLHYVSSHNVKRGSGGRYKPLNSRPLYFRDMQPRVKLPSVDLWARRLGLVAWPVSSETRNAKCPVCGASVWFFRDRNGGCAYFDALGKPWPKHLCIEFARSELAGQKPMLETRSTAQYWTDDRVLDNWPVDVTSPNARCPTCDVPVLLFKDKADRKAFFNVGVGQFSGHSCVNEGTSSELLHHAAVLTSRFGLSSIESIIEEIANYQERALMDPSLHKTIVTGPSPWDGNAESTSQTLGCGPCAAVFSLVLLIIVLIASF